MSSDMRDLEETPSLPTPLDPALLMHAFNTSSFPLGVLQLDRHFRVISISDPALRLLGGTASEALGVPLRQWRSLRSEAAMTLIEMLSGLSAEKTTVTAFTENTEKDLLLNWIGVRNFEAPKPDENAPTFLLMVQEAEHAGNREGAQRRLQEVMSDLFDQSPVGEAYVSIEGEFLKVNRSLCKMLGYSEGELRRADFQTLTHPDDLARDLMKVTDMLAGRIRSYSLEKRYFKKNGELLWANIFVSAHRDADGQIIHFITLIEDISPAKQLEERYEGEVAKLQDQLLLRQHEVVSLNARIDRLALLDPITGLLNQEGLNHELSQSFALASEDSEPFAVIALRLEGYAEFASAKGVDSANALLRKVGEGMINLVRRSDILGRTSKDNFVIGLEQRAIHGVGVAEIAKRITHALSTTYDISGEKVELKVLLGAAEIQQDDTLETLLARAHEKMQNAADTPRN